MNGEFVTRDSRTAGVGSSTNDCDHREVIDHDTGLDCQNMGGASVCDPPNGAVHYYDPDQGLNCTRTGMMSVRSSM